MRSGDPRAADCISQRDGVNCRSLAFEKGGPSSAFTCPGRFNGYLLTTCSLVALGYEKGASRYTPVIKSIRSLICEGSSAMTSCPRAMQDGAALLLQTHLAGNDLDDTSRRVFQNAFDHLISRDPGKAWTSGQWMTERTGGSDVSQTETVATYSPLPSNAPFCDPDEGIPLGPWSIDGFKWFSSATDGNMTILLARTAKGLSAFYAPMRRFNPDLVVDATGKKGGMELNGVAISRLKKKLGTRALPTAELELRGMRGWLLGAEGQGIKQVATILTVTRLGSASGATAHLGRALAIARAFAAVREIGATKGKRVRLVDSPLHMRTLSDMTINYHALMLLAHYGYYVQGVESHGSSASSVVPSSPAAVASITPRSPDDATALLRALTPVIKAYCTKEVVGLTYACMESLGGVGYLENSETEHLNVARLFRDACVNNIWEGTTDVLATDLVRALKHPRVGAASLAALDRLIAAGEGTAANESVRRKWNALRKRMESTPQAELLYDGKEILWTVAEAVTAVLLSLDAGRDNNPEAREMCRRWQSKRGFIVENDSEGRSTVDQLHLNRSIVFGSWGLEKRGLQTPAKL